ncbi:unnamed protein product, partial [Closterium sp. Yama58-4]
MHGVSGRRRRFPSHPKLPPYAGRCAFLLRRLLLSALPFSATKGVALSANPQRGRIRKKLKRFAIHPVAVIVERFKLTPVSPVAPGRLPGFPGPSPLFLRVASSAVVMKPYGRLSHFGLAALVAGLVAISFLATHASAADDVCGNKDCGTDAECIATADGTAVCQCFDGSNFSDLDKTCDGDVCGNTDCGTDATCAVTDDGTAECQCSDGSVFDESDKTCYGGPCATKDCGPDGVCTVRGDGTAECGCRHGYAFDDSDQTCYAPFLRTTLRLQVKGPGLDLGFTEDQNFPTSQPAERASGTTTCADLTPSSDLGISGSAGSFRGDIRITVVWNASNVAAAGNGMCKSVAFHSEPGCTDKPGLTITRPARVGRYYPVTERTVKAMDMPQSVSCEITTCHKDCGAAECVVKDGKAQCKCPWGFVFNEAEKMCSNKSFTSDSDPCKTGTLKCAKNSTCVVKSGQGMCECDAGYTKTGAQCTAICKPACPVNAQCMVVRGMPVCECKRGFKLETSKCTPVCNPTCPANAECKVVKGNPACQCKAGFRMANNKCTPVCQASCPANAQCKVVGGSAQCQCNSGFQMHNSKCTPVCQPSCPANAQCKVVGGRALCQCNGGFQMQNSKCTPVCQPSCPANAQCKVVGGRAQCQCNAGFQMQNSKCTPVCQASCPANAQCKVVGGRAQCQCKSGFQMQNSKCTPVCQPSCPANAQCKVVGGKAACQCKAGFRMQNNKCT